MKAIKSIFALVLLFLVAGCAQNHFNLPKDEMVQRVRVLGVAPLMIDENSDIRFPQKDELFTLLANYNRINERQLVRLLKNSESFYAVVMPDDDPKALLGELMLYREQRDDAKVQYNKYFWNERALREYMDKNSVDALMLVVVSGITRPDKLYSGTLLNSLENNYNFLIMTAQIVDKNGAVLWEYPNFRRSFLKYEPLLNLQYADFEAAKANMDDTVQVKFKSLDGVRRALEKRRLSFFRQETPDYDVYMSQFEDMVSLINLDRTVSPLSTRDTVPIEDAPQ
ncbi:MAG: hypothetical protein RBQ99_05055 [Trichlorobacter sp.]|nr:hypothetical protein [Trichlorobacter sp.]